MEYETSEGHLERHQINSLIEYIVSNRLLAI